MDHTAGLAGLIPDAETKVRWGGWLTNMVNGLLHQRRPALGEDDFGVRRCYYRAGNNKCAAGQLIPDHLYSGQMEGQSIANVLCLWPEVKTALGCKTEQDTTFLDMMQSRLHDTISVCGSKEFRQTVYDVGVAVAQVYGLPVKFVSLQEYQ